MNPGKPDTLPAIIEPHEQYQRAELSPQHGVFYARPLLGLLSLVTN